MLAETGIALSLLSGSSFTVIEALNVQADTALIRVEQSHSWSAAQRTASDTAQREMEEQKRKEEAREARKKIERADRAKRQAVKPAAPVNTGDPRAIARSMVDAGQWSCLDSLWQKESGWNPRAANPGSGAYGIPQALPGSKMASAGADWQTNPATQIKWGLNYIESRYGSPCGAWAHSQRMNWY